MNLQDGVFRPIDKRLSWRPNGWMPSRRVPIEENMRPPQPLKPAPAPIIPRKGGA